ncbi:hypothetical protein [Aquimarina litoralis]|uniref:hypothetical protein n=1 Tax=Aquimarina litoralis TaxID=584605 RepID=UPI001C58615B|nr:hypothetical protein [Aquimarina litoralis]MBW1295219.1 hypothetical protein [Aquimarina litoralis]
MQRILISLLILLVFVSGCHQKKVDLEEDFVKEVNSLSTNDLQKEFLEKIYNVDQESRKTLMDIELKYGYDSVERKEALKTMANHDHKNFQRIELYLQQYGHPTIAKHGDKASRTPCLVIHHSGNIASRERNFEHLYKAYRSGDLSTGSFSFYLERMHRMKFGNRFTLPNPYREEQLIDSLITRLDLSD